MRWNCFARKEKEQLWTNKSKRFGEKVLVQHILAHIDCTFEIQTIVRKAAYVSMLSFLTLTISIYILLEW